MLSVVAADRPEDLLDELVARLATPVADPFAPEWISVPSLGFRTWLQQQLAQRLGATGHRDGIAANLDLPLPGALRWLVLRAHAAHANPGAVDTADPWQVDRLVWSVLDVLSDPPPGLDTRLTRAGLPAGVALASRAAPIADLFDRYDVHRPELLQQWAEGRDVGPDGALDGDRRWQPALYRAVQQHIAQRHGVTERPAQRLAQALQLLRTGELAITRPAGGALPSRLFVFGLSIITADLGPTLDALGQHRDVTVLLLSPSATTACQLARRVAADPPASGNGPNSWAYPRSAAQAAVAGAHPLLSTWGVRPLESALLLGAGGHVPQLVEATPAAPQTLLTRVQADLRAGAIAGPWDWSPTDGSISVHAAPGRTRQVEVLRDVLLGLLRDTPDLAEGDIAVLCPQLEQYAPILSAVLGPPAERTEQPVPGQTPALRYTVVDRDARSLNTVLDAMALLLDLLPGRFDVGAVRELLHAPAVQARFGLTTDDLSLFSDWSEQACIRWGLDGPHRSPWRISPDHDANSWAAGVDQLMMGIALGDDLRDTPLPGQGATASPLAPYALSVGAIAPTSLDDGSIAAAGRLATALRSLAEAHRLLAGSLRPAQNWCADVRRAADLMVAAPRFEDWQRARFDAALDELLAASADPNGQPSPVLLSFGDLRRLLAPSLEGARSRTDLGFGSVVVARPAVLASVPYRVVAILGLDEDALPSGPPSGDDLTLQAPLVGDRDPRAEARAELLAALNAARDHLVITCTSTDVRTNEAVPPSVLLDEFLELVATTTGGEPGQVPTAPAGLFSVHPRQAFHHQNFRPAGLAQPFSFDPVSRDGAAALEAPGPRAPAAGLLLEAPLGDAGDPTGPLELAEVRRFFGHPVQAFFRNRLNVVVPRRAEAASAQLPTSLTALERTEVGGALLAAGLALSTPDAVLVDATHGPASDAIATVLANFAARGFLPPAVVAGPELAAISQEAATILSATHDLGVAAATATITHPIDLVLPDGTRLVGSVEGCRDGAQPGPVRVQFETGKPKHRVALALDLLVLTALHPDTIWHGVLVARGGKAPTPPIQVAQRVAGDDAAARQATAHAALAALLTQYREGLRYPLPLFNQTSYAEYHDARPAYQWGQPDSEYGSFRESQDGYHQIAFGRLTYAELRALDAGGYHLATEAARLWGTLAHALVDLTEEAEEAEEAEATAP